MCIVTQWNYVKALAAESDIPVPRMGPTPYVPRYQLTVVSWYMNYPLSLLLSQILRPPF